MEGSEIIKLYKWNYQSRLCRWLLLCFLDGSRFLHANTKIFMLSPISVILPNNTKCFPIISCISYIIHLDTLQAVSTENKDLLDTVPNQVRMLQWCKWLEFLLCNSLDISYSYRGFFNGLLLFYVLNWKLKNGWDFFLSTITFQAQPKSLWKQCYFNIH